MASVSQLVEEVARIMREPTESVNAYARALIDAGELPKSKGRAIAQVTPQDILALFTAVCLQPKIKDTGGIVREYLDMRPAGVPEGAPDSISFTAGEYLSSLIETSLMRAVSDEDKAARQAAFGMQITYVQNWREIEVRDKAGSVIIRFKSGNPFTWDAFYKRSTVLSGKAFLMLYPAFWETED